MRDGWIRALLAANAVLLLGLLWGASASRERAPLPPPHRYLIADTIRVSPLVATSRSGDVAYQVASGGKAWLRLRRANETGSRDIPPGSDGEFVPLLRADWTEVAPSLSPDGRLMAYGSDESGERYLFVRKFPVMAGRWQISTEPVEPWFVWSPEGDAIFYESAGSTELIRADVELEPSFRVVRRTVLHDEGLVESIADIHPDGQRLLVTHDIRVGTGGQAEEAIVVVANWLTELEERVGRGGRR